MAPRSRSSSTAAGRSTGCASHEHGPIRLNHGRMREEHGPAPTLWPLGFAVGIAVALVGLIINPDGSRRSGPGRDRVRLPLGPRRHLGDAAAGARRAREVREATPARPRARRRPEHAGDRPSASRAAASSRARRSASAASSAASSPSRSPASRAAGRSSARRATRSTWARSTSYPVGKWSSRRSSSIPPGRGDAPHGVRPQQRPVGAANEPSFTIISNRCVHLGCPVQANGPTGAILGEKNVAEHARTGRSSCAGRARRLRVPVPRRPVRHGGQPHRRPAGPRARPLPVRDQERPTRPRSASRRRRRRHGAEAHIDKYKSAGPGEHVDGPRAVALSPQPAAPLMGPSYAEQGAGPPRADRSRRSATRSTGSRSAPASSARQVLPLPQGPARTELVPDARLARRSRRSSSRR